ncbi:unnamed protein product [Phytophthora lilii]|uniref:Unnamed protein product n=1 Tax=Phytophthora lilii TaxID=2077276 RepID=A0A9W6X008_9STRA|nr:unnamed protein product [Phytophthora lilii]
MDEDNVVGTLFLQNGEDNGYDPEDFVQELAVGDSAPRFRISVADDDGGIPGSCAVWNGAVRGVAATSGGQSSLTGNCNACRVRGHLWGSDTAGLVKCLEDPAPSNAGLDGGSKEESQPESGDDEAKAVAKTRFDVAVVAECLWLHHLVRFS